MDQIAHARARLESRIREDSFSVDLLLSIFCSALFNYRRASVCSPFPPHLMNLHDKNFQLAEQIVNSLPPVHQLAQNPSLIRSLSPQAILLLDWLLNLGNIKLHMITRSEFESRTQFSRFAQSTPSSQPGPTPSYIFEIIYNNDNLQNADLQNADLQNANLQTINLQNPGLEGANLRNPDLQNANLQNLNVNLQNSSANLQNANLQNANLQNHEHSFSTLHKQMGSTIGYHGSGLENWHNILHGGLDVKYQKETSIFGMGIYLAEDPNVAHSFKKSGQAWSKSMIGSRMSCVAACEVLNHPEVLRGKEQSSILVDGESHLPKHYIIVKKNQHVRVKYLLIYNDEVKQSSRYWITILVYVAILLFVVLYKSPTFKRSVVDKLHMFYK
eukprot:Phypoly_transcript_09742.p1 GENE.Phypoly_transcript_09742~~Phypoly_transcript_09742.p1  ORF type:complete len:386 (+),score=46.75 Phypoly_transcript_09742:114-1271(+)